MKRNGRAPGRRCRSQSRDAAIFFDACADEIILHHPRTFPPISLCRARRPGPDHKEVNGTTMSVWRCLNQQCSSSTFRLASSTSRSIQARSFSSAARQSNSPFSFALWQGCNEASWRRRRPDLETRNMPRGRRRFATTPVVQHGHLDPPKPGEEYVFRHLNWTKS